MTKEEKDLKEITAFRRLRIKYGITMRDYSIISGHSPSWWHKVESGVVEWKSNELKRLKDYSRYIEKPLKRGFTLTEKQFDEHVKNGECVHIRLYRFRMNWHNIKPLEFKERAFKSLKMRFEELITN